MNANGNSDAFVLRNVPPEPKPWHGDEPENTRQKVLLTGMDCRPGQLDLFKTDGEATEGTRAERLARLCSPLPSLPPCVGQQTDRSCKQQGEGGGLGNDELN